MILKKLQTKTIFSLPFFLLGYLFSTAQEQLIHQPKVFVSKSGNVFWNKKLPVYLKLATSPDDTAKTYWVKSRLTAEYADPFFFDTEGANLMRTKWAINKKTKKVVEPKIEVVWEIYNDSKSPKTQIRYMKSGYYENKGVLYFKNTLKVMLTAKDELSGVEKIYYSINKSEYAPFEDTLSFAQEGTYTLKYYSVDPVGNVENPQTVYIVVDESSPVTELQNVGEWNESTASARSGIKLVAADNQSGVKNTLFSIDGGKEQIYKSAIYTNNISEGEHSISYYSIDAIGNKEEVAQFDFYIDKKSPLITLETVGDKYTVNGKEFSSGRSRIKLTAVDNKSGVKEIWYSVGNEKYQPYDKPFYLSGKGGNTSIKFYAVDYVNNKSLNTGGSNQNVSTPYLDLTGPKLSNDFYGPIYKSRDTLFISPKTKIVLGGSDSEAGLQKISYKINGGEEVDYSGPFTIEKDGYYEITQYGYDNVNNSNRKEFFLVVDASGPETFPRFSVAPFNQKVVEGNTVSIFPVQTELYLAATDDKVGNHKIIYSINGGTERLYSSPILGFEAGKKYDIQVKAYDWLDNKTLSTISFEILKK